MARFFTPVLPAIAATLLFAACVDLTPPWAGHVDGSGQGGLVSSDVAAGGDGGSTVVDPDGGSGGAGGGAQAADVATGGSAAGGAGGVPTTGGTTGTALADAADSPAVDVAEPDDGRIDVPLSLDLGYGGASGTGGTNGTGGAGAIDGPRASGGTKATGGTLATGGTKATGGTLATGGTISTGGTRATGGTLATGGMIATGGTLATGGMIATGGTLATGGTISTGGMIATGGAGGTATPMIVSIRFVGGRTGGTTGTTTLLATESAGFKPATNWNSVASSTGTLASLVAADGSTTSASATWNSPGTYAHLFTDTTGDAHMMSGFLEARDTTSVTVGVTLPSSMSGGYDVYVYCYGYIDTTTRTYQYAIQDATQLTTKSVSQTGHSATIFPGHSPAPAVGGAGAGTYVLFQNLTGTTFTLTATPLSSSATPTPILRAPVNGIQIVYPSGS